MATYTIKKGDTLSKIAKQYGTTVSDLAKSNNISDVNKIYTGQSLNIGSSAGQNNTSSSSATTSSGISPTVSTNPNATQASNSVLGSTQSYSNPDVNSAYEMYQSLLNNTPSSYQSRYSSQIDDLLNRITNREKFSYDAISDPLYQQYKDQYVNLGKNAMMDTMGNAATLTGGYGNSYASTAGNQAYQGYLQQLNDVVPDLYNASLSQYNNDGNDLYNQLAGYQNAEATDYGRYRDTVGDYYSQLGNAQSAYDMLYGNEYQERQDALALASANSSRSSSGSGSGSTSDEDDGTLSINDILTSKQLKTLENVYENEGPEGVYSYLNKFDFLDDEWNILNDYMSKDLNFDLDAIARAGGASSMPYVKWDMISNLLGAGNLIEQNNNSNPLPQLYSRERVIQAGVPESMVLTEDAFNVRKRSGAYNDMDSYTDYLNKVYQNYFN